MERLALDERTLLFGARSDAMECLTAAEVFVLSSAWEGLPLGRLGAMSTGLSAVAARTGEDKEVAREDSGPLGPACVAGALAQAILCLCEDPDLRQAMAEFAAQAAKCFNDATGWTKTLAGVHQGLLR